MVTLLLVFGLLWNPRFSAGIDHLNDVFVDGIFPLNHGPDVNQLLRDAPDLKQEAFLLCGPEVFLAFFSLALHPEMTCEPQMARVAEVTALNTTRFTGCVASWILPASRAIKHLNRLNRCAGSL